MDLVSQVYKLTESFPRSEEFALKMQLRRAAVSVPSNIAEGLTRRSVNDKTHFLNVAQSSLSEIDTQVDIAFRLSFIDKNQYLELENNLINVQKLVSGLTRSFK